MSRYSLSLPNDLKQEAERLADAQGVSLNQFILWAVAEKVGGLARGLDDPRFPQVTYRKSASGSPAAVLRGPGTRVQTVATAHAVWGWSAQEIAKEFGLRLDQVEAALAFYRSHQREIDLAREAEAEVEKASA